MSSLLEQAIIDAAALREAAIKNAESAILNKYSADIREAVDSLLEQEDEKQLLTQQLIAPNQKRSPRAFLMVWRLKVHLPSKKSCLVWKS